MSKNINHSQHCDAWNVPVMDIMNGSPTTKHAVVPISLCCIFENAIFVTNQHRRY